MGVNARYSEFAATIGLAELRGRAVDLADTPLDSFRIVGSVQDSTGFYTVVSFVTSKSGSYSLRLRRTATVRTDPVRVTVTATSMKVGDRMTDGMNQYARQTSWLPFIAESDTVTSRSLNIIVPFRRR